MVVVVVTCSTLLEKVSNTVAVENCRHTVVVEICILSLVMDYNMEEVVDKHIHEGVLALCMVL